VVLALNNYEASYRAFLKIKYVIPWPQVVFEHKHTYTHRPQLVSPQI